MNKDIAGTRPVFNATEESDCLSRLRAILTATKKALEMGQRASISEDKISFDFESDYTEFREIANVIGVYGASRIITLAACSKYNRKYRQPFLLSDECVAYEYYEHVLAYQWAVGDRYAPNDIVIAWSIVKGSYDADSVIDATRSIDISLSNVKPGDYQSLAFGYRNGIRSCYIGTQYDPWRDSR